MEKASGEWYRPHLISAEPRYQSLRHYAVAELLNYCLDIKTLMQMIPMRWAMRMTTTG